MAEDNTTGLLGAAGIGSATALTTGLMSARAAKKDRARQAEIAQQNRKFKFQEIVLKSKLGIEDNKANRIANALTNLQASFSKALAPKQAVRI